MADDVEWDPRRAAANLKKHHVDFADATVLYDDRAVTIRDEDATEEDTSRSEWMPWRASWLWCTGGGEIGRA